MTGVELERFWAKISPATDGTGCLLWTGATGGEGYGWFRLDRRAQPAHRVAYEHFVEAIPEGLTLDHLCRNRLCVNWLHVEPVTRGENVLRGVGFASTNAAKTHCWQGHEYTPENTYRSRGGHRRCRICTLERNRRRRLHAGAAA